MSEFIIDFSGIDTKEKAHEYLRKRLNFPAYYGNNLDGLWDVLLTIDIETQIIIKNHKYIISDLPDYGEKLINTFIGATEVNKKLTIVFSD